jgi:replication-associated recombination protein RarA
MRELGYGRGYQSAQRAPGRFLAEDYLPDDYREEPIYQPSEEGREQRMVEDHRRRTHDHFRLRSDTNEAGPAASSASDETNG